MKTTTCLSLFVLMSLFASAAESRGEEPVKMQSDASANKSEDGRPARVFSLSIQVKQKDRNSKEKEMHLVHVGEAVYIVATVSNASQDKLTFVETNPPVDFHLTVLDSNEKPVPRTLYGDRILQRQNSPQEHFRVVSKQVSPGESLQYELNLSRQFDLSLAGTYSVQASCEAPRKDGSGPAELNSNVLAFELQ